MAVEEKAPSVTFKVKLFGLFREAAGNKEVAVQVGGDQATVGDLKRSLHDSYPKLASMNAPFIVAVNRKIVDDSTKLMPDDELAILPLVSGG